jgi:hypothetical protein
MAFLASTVAVVMLAMGVLPWFADTTTTQSLSPDEGYRITLVEIKPNTPLRIDRNFKLLLATLDTEDKRETNKDTLFRSPDEGKPIGSERFVWSRDSTYVLLVGKHFFVAGDLAVGNGEQAYFLYHLPSKRSWCNSKQASGTQGQLTGEQLREIDFVQPVELRRP